MAAIVDHFLKHIGHHISHDQIDVQLVLEAHLRASVNAVAIALGHLDEDTSTEFTSRFKYLLTGYADLLGKRTLH